MFDSLKKKFAETSGKLKNKVEEEAKQEDNIELIEENIENLSDGEVSVDSDLELEDSISEDLELNEDLNDMESENNEKSGFLSFFKRNKFDNDEKSSNKNLDDESEYIEEKFSLDDVSGLDEELVGDSGSSGLDDVSGLDEELVGDSGSPGLEDNDDEETEKGSEKSKSHVGSFLRRDKKDENDESKSGGFLSFIREKSISESDVEDILFELELSLLEADVAMEVASTIVDSLKQDLIGQKIKRSSDIDGFVFDALKKVVSEIIDIKGPSMTEMLEEKVAQGEPLVVMLIGINGTGKTTTIGKLCNFYIKKGYTPVIAASDTFRAGAIEQIEHHANNLDVKLIKHEKGSDPAAVAFDAVQHAKAKGKEIVFIDTAGRMQTNVNLMDEMKKIRRVSNPDLIVFVGDALTGNDATEQARKFNESIDIDGVILTKADADSKGGASLSIGYVIKKPILFLGMGQSYDDIKEYDADWMLEQIFS